MAQYELAQVFILKNEGGYVDDPNDSGSETYRGISRRNFPDWNGWPVIDLSKPLSHNQVIANPTLDDLVNTFYKTNFWDKILGDGIVNQAIATYCYDWYVNAGRNAIKNIQAVLGVAEDGVFGGITLKALNAAGNVLKALHQKRVGYYQEIAVGDNARFLGGWENRANGLYERLA